MFDWLFLPRCAACETPADTLCEVCAASLDPLDPRDPGARDPDELAIVSPWRYGGALATAIQRLKFGRETHVARSLAPLWAGALGAVVAASDAIVVPIPLHWRRRVRRGFDQAWLLAVHACRAGRLPPPVSALSRIRATASQSTLPAAQRQGNVHDAFSVRDRRVARRSVVLVDDVATTGATLAAAARALVAAGAIEIVGITLARATFAPG
jgi:ComF family protein